MSKRQVKQKRGGWLVVDVDRQVPHVYDDEGSARRGLVELLERYADSYEAERGPAVDATARTRLRAWRGRGVLEVCLERADGSEDPTRKFLIGRGDDVIAHDRRHGLGVWA